MLPMVRYASRKGSRLVEIGARLFMPVPRVESGRIKGGARDRLRFMARGCSARSVRGFVGTAPIDGTPLEAGTRLEDGHRCDRLCAHFVRTRARPELTRAGEWARKSVPRGCENIGRPRPSRGYSGIVLFVHTCARFCAPSGAETPLDFAPFREAESRIIPQFFDGWGTRIRT